MKGVLVILAVGGIILVGLLLWLDTQVASFEARCVAVGGHAEFFGNSMSSLKCLSPDGRVIEVPAR